MSYEEVINKCCMFGIIFYLDVGKIMLIEKLFFFGGVIQSVGVVKNNKIKKLVIFDFMEIEKQCGIFVVMFVMVFEYVGKQINIFDILGYKDFVEDIFCMLMVVDFVILVIDCVNGVEE